MKQIIVSKVSKGVKTIIAESEVSDEHAQKVAANFAKMIANKKERMQKRIDEVPKINWEILRYANHHTKDECLQKYPKHVEFINKIQWDY